MKVTYDAKDYEFDLEEIDVSQATQIKRKYGLTLIGLENGLRDGDPDALRCVFWLMLAQNGERVNIDNVQFKVIKFINSIQQANAKLVEEAEAKEADNPKESE